MAAFRALESAKPARQRLFEDRYASRFIPGWQRWLVQCARLLPLQAALGRAVDRQAPGARSSGIARTRLIDDWIRREAQVGCEQLVMLGAGFDCRALRLPELAAIQVFEVDRPELIAFKRARLRVERAGLTRVCVDFKTQSLAQQLERAGFAADRKTLFVWEGVTNYLDAQSVRAVFEWVARSGPQARIIFSYVHAAALSGSFDAPGLPALLDKLRALGEPWTFGFEPEALPAYLTELGLRLREDLGAAQYRRLYWPGSPDREGYEFYRVASADQAAGA